MQIFIEIGFADETVFIFVRYSATKNRMPKNDSFRSQGNLAQFQ
jgi:hypothetical protein